MALAVVLGACGTSPGETAGSVTASQSAAGAGATSEQPPPSSATPEPAPSLRMPAVEGAVVTVTLLNEAGEPSEEYDPVTTGPMDITVDPSAQLLGIPSGPPGQPIDGLSPDAQIVSPCEPDGACDPLRIDLEALPEGEYTFSVERAGELDVSSVRMAVERTPPTADVDVWGDWTLTGIESRGDAIPVPEDAEFTMSVEGISVTGDIGCNAYSATLTVDGDAVRARFGGQTAVLCPDAEDIAGGAFANALNRVDHAERTPETLILSSEDVALTFERP